MSFFDSEFVRAEMAEISELQEEIYGSVFKFPSMTKEDKIRHVNLLEKLLSKQQVLYTRMSLSDDPEAQEMKERISDSARMMGLPPSFIISPIHKDSGLLEETKLATKKSTTSLSV